MRKVLLSFGMAVLCLAVEAFAATTQTAAPFALNRIDQREGTSGAGDYVYSYDGLNTRIYVVDNGVQAIGDIAGRVLTMGPFLEFWKSRQALTNTGFVDNLQPPCLEHGTQVASLAAGSIHGAGKRATIVDVRIGPCIVENGRIKTGPFWDHDIPAALQAIADQHPPSTPGVVNLSFRSPELSWKESYRTAITKLRDKGLVVVLSADSGDAVCTKSVMPSIGADLEGVITVSASSPSDGRGSDIDSQGVTIHAGLGPCVELFAPTPTKATKAKDAGGNIITADFAGTSAATAIVSGVAAMILQQHPWMTPSEVESALIDNATKNKLTISSETPNRLVFTRLPVVGPRSIIYAGQTQTVAATVEGATPTRYTWEVPEPAEEEGAVTGSSVVVRAPSNCSVGSTIKPTVQIEVSGEPGQTRVGYGRLNIFGPTASFSYHYYTEPFTEVKLCVPLGGAPPWNVVWSDGYVAEYFSSPATRKVTPSQSTFYRFTDLRDASGCPALYSVAMGITVTTCPAPDATITAPAAAKASETRTASVPATAGATYQWTVENGTIWNGQGTNSIQYTLGCSGTTTVRATVTASCGRPSESSASTLIWEPRLNVGGGETIAAGQPAYVHASFSGTAPWQITWSDGVRITSILGSSYFYEVSPPVTTTYTATFKDKNGCTGPVFGSATVTVE